MTLQGQVYAAIRTDVLRTFPVKVHVSPSSTLTLSNWISTGSYVVSSISKKSVTIEAAEDDMAAVLLTEVETFLNHCFEQMQEIGCACSDERVRSDAWNVVTIYYFGFFASQVFLRLIGRPSLYLDRDTLQAFASASGFTDVPGAGAFVVEPWQSIGVNRISFQLKKSKFKVHETSWNGVFTYFDQLLKQANLAKGDPESDFYSSFSPKRLRSIYSEFDWPAEIRAAANYSAGYAYQLVSRKVVANTKVSLSPWAGTPVADFQKVLPKAAMRCAGVRVDDFAAHVAFLSAMSLTLFDVARSLYKEVYERRDIDRRWESARRRFHASTVFGLAGEPFADVALLS